MLTCDCDPCGGGGQPPITREGSAARGFRFTAAPLTRRRVLGGALAATAVAIASPAAASRAPSAIRDQPCDAPSALLWPDGISERRLALSNAATGESFDGVIWANGRFEAEALVRLNTLMRDMHAGTVPQCDARLFELLACVQAHVRRPFHVLSGFRTPETNAALARSDTTVAPNSFHMRGMAVDLFIEGVAPREVAQKARDVGAGGVGAGTTFVHLDTGPIRSWTY